MTAPHLDVHLSPDAAEQALRRDALVGLTAEPKWLPPKWFYDDRGSELFEEITALPEYYPTRTERALLAEHAGAVAAATGADTLVELGSGSSEKTRLLLDAMQEQGTLRRYVPQDVSRSALATATAEVAAEYPGVQVQGVVGDFTADLEALPRGNRRMIAFLGGTLGNLVPAERTAFLAAVRAALVDGEHLLLGVGLVTDPQVLVPAYDDAAGVTAEFNRNVLHVLNRELGANFDVDAFEHVAVWDAEQEWIEMRLQATRAMRVHVAELDLDVSFAAGEQLRTEVSAKFRLEGVQAELAAVGLEAAGTWTDPDQRFALLLARAT